jgi:hypothetical protein
MRLSTASVSIVKKDNHLANEPSLWPWADTLLVTKDDLR